MLAMTGQITVHAIMVRPAKVFAWQHQVKPPAGAGELANVAFRLQVPQGCEPAPVAAHSAG